MPNKSGSNVTGLAIRLAPFFLPRMQDVAWRGSSHLVTMRLEANSHTKDGERNKMRPPGIQGLNDLIEQLKTNIKLN